MSSTCPVLFLLFDSTGQPYKATSADKVSVLSSADVMDFRKAVKAENTNSLSHVDASQLIVYKNKEAFDKRNAQDGKEEPLEEDCLIHGLGATMKNALVVVVPSSGIPSQSIAESGVPKVWPHPEREKRWIEINKILKANRKADLKADPKAKKKAKRDSTAYSSASWDQLKSLFDLKKFGIVGRTVDDGMLDFLCTYLNYATKCLGDLVKGSEAKRVHFIAPFLICVCVLFNGGVEIVAEENLVGNFVQAHSRFDFMLKRGEKAICIVQAKKENFEQGMAQDLLGCEVAAEVCKLDFVYGIVTNYVQWIFLCSCNETVREEMCSLEITSNGPTRGSVKKIVEMIYGMLWTDPIELRAQ